MSVTSWFLVSGSGARHRLPKEMIFVGREDCELMLQSRSVDKQHAVINYNAAADQHLVKDLGSLNGTFVNDLRIPDQTYVTLKVSDILRFGYDSHVYVLEKSQHQVPEEALKHEKYTSQLQISLKASRGEKAELEKNAAGKSSAQELPAPRPTPLYGQPSWWGEDDCGSRAVAGDQPQKEEPDKDAPRPEAARDVRPADPDSPECLSTPRRKSISPSYRREAGYFEIPTKDSSLPKAAEAELQEIPTKDTAGGLGPDETPLAIQSHASFTIEFDDLTPGKIKIKDHVTKFSSRLGKTPRSAKMAPAEALSSRSKVADWLVGSHAGAMRTRPACDDVYSTKSDLAVNIKSLKGHHHDDGTQSDSEDPALQGQRSGSQLSQTQVRPRPASPEPPGTRSSVAEPCERPSQRAFVIEFFDDNPRKKRSQSFTHNPEPDPGLKAKPERRKGGERPASVHGHAGPAQQVTVKREQADAETSRSSSAIFVRPFGSVGKKSKLAQDSARGFAAESQKDSRPDSSSGGEPMTPPPLSAPPVMVSAPSPAEASAPPATDAPPSVGAARPPPLPPLHFPGADGRGCQRPPRNEEDDSVSEAGTYTIDSDAHNQEVEDARNMIDQVFGVLDSPEYAGPSPGTPRPVIDESRAERENGASRGVIPPDFGLATSPLQAPAPGGPKWLSRWAGLADGCAAPGEGSPAPVRPSEGDGDEAWESESGRRTRRLLPRVPSEKGDGGLPGCRDSSQERHRADPAPPSPGGRRDSARRQADPDGLSDAGRSEDGPVSRPAKSRQAHNAVSSSSSAKRALFYIGSDQNAVRPDPAGFSAETPPTAVLIRHLGGQQPRRGGVKANGSAPEPPTRNSDGVPMRDAPPLVHRESFTKVGPVENVPVEKPPRVGSRPSIGDSEGRTDAESFLREAGGFPSPGSRNDDSLSGESDLDTASGVSQVSGKRTPAASADGEDETPSARREGRQPSARERLSEKRRSQPPATPADKAEAAKRLQMRRGAGARGSLTSDHEASRAPGRAKKEDGAKAAQAQPLTRSNSLSAPRPTRASMLRRARLGEASDNEGADTDRASQSSDQAAPAPEAKKLSRLDILALPRKRTASFTAAGDGETSPAAGRPAFSARNADPPSAARKSAASDARPAAGRAAGKNPPSRTRSTGAKHPKSGVRPRRKNSDLSSSSDEDYKSVATNAAKAKRCAQSPRGRQTPGARSQSLSLETEEDPYQNWSTHSAEIAKLSHDLAKDLAILAKEIHEAAGDGDCAAGPPAAAAAPDTSASAAFARREDARPLSPLRHLSRAIRDNTEQLATKLKLMFRNREDAWEQIDKQTKADAELSLPTTSDQEISSIVAELARVQRQLQVINWAVDPAGSLQAAAQSAPTISAEKKGAGGAQKTRRHVL
ncbi:centrosomal protein of 170 kDa protein B-like isoform X2 [Hippocampus zosterae]|uniref:centrosomal protein of 170 kDa protein B-like isoform X2 n=1 Tax=Hippocampus zosterae TaxID=109293 RepID=UPI00223CB797|nr:centrosomal protein of 170 kDa protein B-like isoform X2 [Hippocampus zosterae]